MGINEHGVVIGNEATFSKLPPRKENKYLIGMDLLRLGLERGATAKDALEIIITLTEQYGQGGNCGHSVPQFYENAYLIADAHEAFHLELIDRMWAWKRVNTKAAISNGISLGEDIEKYSPELESLAIRKKWLKPGVKFNLFNVYAARIMTHLGQAKKRQQCNLNHMQPDNESPLRQMMKALRSHGEHDADPNWNPLRNRWLTVCAHCNALTAPAQTTNSFIAWVPEPGKMVVLSTSGSTPCVSTFRPVMIQKEIHQPPLFIQNDTIAGKRASLDADWWAHEKYVRYALNFHHDFLQNIAPQRDSYENQLIEQNLFQWSQSDLHQAGDTIKTREKSFIESKRSLPIEGSVKKYQKFWRAVDQRTGLDLL
jgi:hypothetical protein